MTKSKNHHLFNRKNLHHTQMGWLFHEIHLFFASFNSNYWFIDPRSIQASQVKGVLQMGESTDPSAPVRFKGVVFEVGKIDMYRAEKKYPSSKSCFFANFPTKVRTCQILSKISTKNQLPSPNMFPGLPNNSCIKTITPTHILPPQNCVCHGNLNGPPPMRPSPRNKGSKKALLREN